MTTEYSLVAAAGVDAKAKNSERVGVPETAAAAAVVVVVAIVVAVAAAIVVAVPALSWFLFFHFSVALYFSVFVQLPSFSLSLLVSNI